MIRPGTILVALVALLPLATAHAQSRQVPAPPQVQPIIIHNATVHTVSGETITRGWVVFEDGRISQVGSGVLPRVRGALKIPARGLHVYPGLVATATTLGLIETGAVDVTHDSNEYGRITPEVTALVAVNPDSDLLPVARAAGILTAQVMPRGGLLPGRASIIRLDGWTTADLSILDDAGLVLHWPRTSIPAADWLKGGGSKQRAELEKGLREIDDLFDAAEAWGAARAADPDLKSDLRYEAMAGALAGQRPVFVHASTVGQIASALAWAQGRGLRIVIVGGSEADRVTDLLVEHDVPVILTGVHRMPAARHVAYDEPYRLASILHARGVRFCIAAGEDAAHERNLPHHAATAAAFGLPREVALRAVTLDAAEILGVGDRLGSIEVGKSATLILATGDPLEITTDVVMAFIDGRRIDLGNRHEALWQKYRLKYRQLGLIDD